MRPRPVPLSGADVTDWVQQVAGYAAVPWTAQPAPQPDLLSPSTAFVLVFGPVGYPQIVVGFNGAGDWLYARIDGAPVPAVVRSSGEATSTVAALLVTSLTETAALGTWADWHRLQPHPSPSWVRRAAVQDSLKAQRDGVLARQALEASRSRAASERQARARRAALDALVEAHPEEFAELLEHHQVLIALGG